MVWVVASRKLIVVTGELLLNQLQIWLNTFAEDLTLSLRGSIVPIRFWGVGMRVNSRLDLPAEWGSTLLSMEKSTEESGSTANAMGVPLQKLSLFDCCWTDFQSHNLLRSAVSSWTDLYL